MSIKKKVKVSKNKKKSWRKHTDITEIEEFLDNKRFEERVGIAITEAQDEELFMIEKAGDNKAYEEKLEKMQTRKSAINVEQSKLRKISSGYKLYGKLESTSNVPAIRSKDPHKEKRKTVYNDDAKLEKFWNDKKDSIQQGKQMKDQKMQDYVDPKKKFQMYDLWDEKNEKSIEGADYLVSPKLPIKVPVHLRQKPSLLPAVEVPVGGQSYNPDAKQHKQLILQAAGIEMEKLNEEAKWTKKVDKYFVSKANAPNEQTWINEMSQGLGLFEHEQEQADTENTGDMEEMAKFAKLVKFDKKKTKQQRRRELREKLVKKDKEIGKKLKVRESQVFRLKTFKKELEQRDQKIARRAQVRAEIHIASLYKPKRLSKYRFVESDMPLNLPGEVSGSLRAVKVEGNLLEDRFKSMQKRNIIETRVPQSIKRKFKLKKEVKRRHKPAVDPTAA